ncbi:S-layer homology domain-containing protein [Pseudobacteroides cellulosolvens]|uniref:S-layer domain-containing protein n=1 Tax=Pseudobacteroides cellulosolvens ATCC 35603 = DSM 2933 TaxID=398512 RepID=A0A0L6JVL9_9FIRM|nr:S-layer homology domain-containing protein [Pseudobacteroides cellulosolvens]KNY29754.1 S-layer domain-containing protein [Pseudobacteroides cellulosolvens ATCC 35603 = DSM 2933]
MKSKIRSRLLNLVIAVSLISIPSNYSLAENPSIDTAANNLVNLKIMQGYGDGDLRLQNKINRSEFVTLIVKMLGYDSDSDLDTYKLSFKDVSKTNWAYNYIKAAVKNKLAYGTNENKFNPANNITYAEALTVMVRALGYENSLKGQWPQNVIEKASELGIDNNIELEPNTQITRGEMALIIDNSISIETVD